MIQSIYKKNNIKPQEDDLYFYFYLNLQRPWHEYEHNFQIMYKVGMGHKPPIPEKLSTEGKDFLGHCLESEPKRRWTASMLLDHPFVKVRLANVSCDVYHQTKNMSSQNISRVNCHDPTERYNCSFSSVSGLYG